MGSVGMLCIVYATFLCIQNDDQIESLLTKVAIFPREEAGGRSTGVAVSTCAPLTKQLPSTGHTP